MPGGGEKMNFAIIPCRMGSKRFYGKPLALINDESMVAHVYGAICSCLWIDGVVVAVEECHEDDSADIGDECLVCRIPVVGTWRHPTGSDRCFEAAQRMGIKRGVIINVQGDEPLITHGHIRQLVGLFDNPKVQVGTLVYGSGGGNYDDVDVQFDNTGRILDFSRTDDGYTYTSIGIIGFRLEVLADFARLGQSEREKTEGIELLRCLDNNIPVHCAVSEFPTIAVDRPEDIAKVEAVLNDF